MTTEKLEEKVTVTDNNDLGLEDLAGTPLDEFILELRNSDDIYELKGITDSVLSEHLSHVRLDKNNDAQLTVILQCIMMDFQSRQKIKSYLKANKSSLVKRGSLNTAAVVLASIMILILHAEFDSVKEQITLFKNQILKVLMGKGKGKAKASNFLKRSLKDLSEEQLMLLLNSPLLEPFKIPETLVDIAKQLLSEHLQSYKKKR